MLAILLGVFAALCWGIHDLVARMLAAQVGPFRMAAWVMEVPVPSSTVVVLAMAVCSRANP